MTSPKIYCKYCGRELRLGAKFCGECGRTVAPAEYPATETGPNPSDAGYEAAAPPEPAAGSTAPAPAPDPDPQHGERPPSDAWQRMSRRPAVLIGAGALLVVVLVAVLVVTLHPFQSSASNGTDPPPPAGGLPATSESQAPTDAGSSSARPANSGSSPSELQAAQDLATLLETSASERSSVNSAYNDVVACGPDLQQDAQAFRDAETSRKQLLSQLSGDSSLAALPAQMIQNLTGAWQASAQVDDHYAAWAQHEASAGCTNNDTTDPRWQAAVGQNKTATDDKTSFLAAWNQIANTYGLPTYSLSQL